MAVLFIVHLGLCMRREWKFGGSKHTCTASKQHGCVLFDAGIGAWTYPSLREGTALSPWPAAQEIYNKKFLEVAWVQSMCSTGTCCVTVAEGWLFDKIATSATSRTRAAQLGAMESLMAIALQHKWRKTAWFVCEEWILPAGSLDTLPGTLRKLSQ